MTTPDGAGRAPASFRTALRDRNFALMWSGQSLSAVGNQMFPVALAILVLRGGGGAGRLGLILAIQTVALVVGTFAAAAFGDRWRRTRVMIATDIVRAAAVVVIAVGGTHQRLAVLETMVALVGFGEGIFQPVFS